MDLLLQGEEYWLAVIAPHAPAWQCTAVPEKSALLMYASSLHNMGWFPDQPGAEASAVAERLARESRLAVPLHQSPVEGQRSWPHTSAWRGILTQYHDRSSSDIKHLAHPVNHALPGKVSESKPSRAA